MTVAILRFRFYMTPTDRKRLGWLPGKLAWYPFWLTGLLLFVAACQSPPPKAVTPAFYYWKTTFQLSPAERQTLRQQAVRKIYLRVFDVDWNPQTKAPEPKAVLRFADRPESLTVVPVVFITNQTLVHCPAGQLPALARNLVQKIARMGQEGSFSYTELQLDCDWTAISRERYFSLLRQVRQQFKGTLSATIRLHQIKYVAQTGVPPVDRGMLMAYNMADWKRADTRNSIFDLAVADRYLASLDQYPLPLDVVLPLFRWTAVYRNNRFLTLLNNLDGQTLAAQPYLHERTQNQFVALHDTTALGFSIWKGDLFRAEDCPPDALLEGKHRLLSKIQNQNLTFALYHLDSTVLSPYSNAFLHTLFQPTP